MKQARKAALTRSKKVALAASSLSTLALLPAGAEAGIVFHNTAIGPNTGSTSNTWDVDGSGGTTFKLNGVRSVVSSNQVASTAKGFSNGVPGYFGFKFTDAGGSNLYYGWAKMTIDASNNAYTINEWAYNSTAGGSISVGQTADVSAVPEPSALSLALIGIGAGGVLAWRRRKQAQALTA